MTRSAHLRSEGRKKMRSVCEAPRNVLGISIFLCSLRAKIQLWLSIKSQSIGNKKNERRFFFVYSIFNPQKRREKGALEIIKKGIEKFGKNCHLPRLSIITTTNMCIWIFFLYARWFFYAFALNSLLLGDGEKKAAREANEEA